MATAQAAYGKRVQVSANGTSNWFDVPSEGPSLSLGGDLIDDTVIGGDGWRSRIYGLRDWSVNCDCNYIPGNAATEAIRTAFMNRSALHVRYLPNGLLANGTPAPGGVKGAVVVENFNLSGDVGGKEESGITLQGNGALTDAA